MPIYTELQIGICAGNNEDSYQKDGMRPRRNTL